MANDILSIVSQLTVKALTEKKFESRKRLSSQMLDSINKRGNVQTQIKSDGVYGYYLTYKDFLNGTISPGEFSLQQHR